VWAALDVDLAARALAPLGLPVIVARSAAPDRLAYLQRPDLGRALAPESVATLRAAAPAAGCDVALVLADGLSAVAAQRHGPALLAALVPRLHAAGLSVGPLCLAAQARVALADHVGAALGARLAVMLLGERPGLGAPDSLGAYLVHGPRPGRTDAERNCVSNVRPEGLAIEHAAELLVWLAVEALRRGLSGVALKDERALPRPVAPPALRDG
jgi:ethanolamine ammonia-lyase small subunit